MARTTATKVKEIISTSLDDTIIDGYINGATLLIDNVLGTNTTLGDELLAEIERWLSAHMLASTREQQLKAAKAGSASATFQGVTGKGLESTLYGQNVLMLDTTGAFASLGGKSVSILAVEEDYS